MYNIEVFSKSTEMKQRILSNIINIKGQSDERIGH